jgi:hypothetical protein
MSTQVHTDMKDTRKQHRTPTQSRGVPRHFGAAQSLAATVPPVVQDVLASPGQPLGPEARTFMEPRFGHDFSQVRVHTDAEAAKSARAVSALAYTVGQDVVFGAGQYAPGTHNGSALLAHELVHTLQQSDSKEVSAGSQLRITAATDPMEREAGAAATAALQGKPNMTTTHAPLQIARQPSDPAPAPANDPFANEDPGLRRRRLVVIKASQSAVGHLRNALSGGYLWSFETVTVDGRAVKYENTQETVARREARLRQLMVDLALMSSELQAAPIPSAWLAPEIEFSPDSSMEAGGADPILKDTKMFYGHRGRTRGQDSWLIFVNWLYMNTAPLPTPAVRRARISPGTPTGIYIHVSDPKNAPRVYRRLTGHEGWQKQGTVKEVWEDDIGPYYQGKDSKIYLPGRP